MNNEVLQLSNLLFSCNVDNNALLKSLAGYCRQSKEFRTLKRIYENYIFMSEEALSLREQIGANIDFIKFAENSPAEILNKYKNLEDIFDKVNLLAENTNKFNDSIDFTKWDKIEIFPKDLAGEAKKFIKELCKALLYRIILTHGVEDLKNIQYNNKFPGPDGNLYEYSEFLQKLSQNKTLKIKDMERPFKWHIFKYDFNGWVSGNRIISKRAGIVINGEEELLSGYIKLYGKPYAEGYGYMTNMPCDNLLEMDYSAVSDKMEFKINLASSKFMEPKYLLELYFKNDLYCINPERYVEFVNLYS